MKKKLMLMGIAALAYSGFICVADSVFVEDFEKGKGACSSGKIVLAEDRKSNVLEHNGGAMWIWCKDLKRGVKYKLSFWAKSESENTFENNPLTKKAFRDVHRKKKGLILPEWTLQFYDDNKAYKQSRILYSYYKIVYSNKWKKYEDVFFLAPGSTVARIIFRNGSKAKLLIDDVSVEEIKESALNINPEFKYGKYNHTGYGMAGYGSSVKMIKRPDSDKCNLLIPTWIGTDPMPIKAGKNYVVHAKLAPDATKGTRFNITFFDKNFKSIKQSSMSIPLAKREGKANFIAPENAEWFKMLLYGKKGNKVKFEFIKVTEEPLETDK